MPSFMRISLIAIALLMSSWAAAQYRHFDNLEVQLGFKNHKADQGDFGFAYNDDTVTIERTRNFGPPDIQAIIGIGTEFELRNNFYLGVKGEFNITNATGGGFQVGAGYRLKLNYFMRIQPELLLSWATVLDTLGRVSYSPRQLTLNGVKFWPGDELTAMYRSHQYGLQPKISLVADFAKKFEFRYTMMYQMNFIYNQAIQIRSGLTNAEPVKTAVPFRSEFMTTTLDGEALEKPLLRPSGFTVRVGLAYKFPIKRR